MDFAAARLPLRIRFNWAYGYQLVQPRPRLRLRRHDLHQRVSPLPNSADDLQGNPALVRRHARRLDRLPAVFQSLLFAGYAYAHFTNTWLRPGRKPRCTSLSSSPPSRILQCTARLDLATARRRRSHRAILTILAITIGLPYLVLSATGPLLQAWFARSFPGRTPYRLYALSNVGSLLALLSYPFLFEREFDLTEQAHLWSAGFIAFAFLCAYAAWRHTKIARRCRPSLINDPPVLESVAGIEPHAASVPVEAHRAQRRPLPHVAAAPRVRLGRPHGDNQPHLDRRRGRPDAVDRPARPLPAHVHHRVRSPKLVLADNHRRSHAHRHLPDGSSTRTTTSARSSSTTGHDRHGALKWPPSSSTRRR